MSETKLQEQRSRLIRELTSAAGIPIKSQRIAEVAKLSTAVLEAVRVEFADGTFERQPGDFIAVLRALG